MKHRQGSSAPSRIWLWFTVLFANFSEAIAEGRGKAQAEALRRSRQSTEGQTAPATHDMAHRMTIVLAGELHTGDMILAEAGDVIAADGEIIEGIASVDESAITGESAPVIRESGGDRSAVTGGTRVLSDWLVITRHQRTRRWVPRPHDRPYRRGETPEDTERDRPEHPARGVHDHLSGCMRHAAPRISVFSVHAAGQGTPVTVTVLVALLVCLIPTTIGGLLSAIGIAGMDRMIRHNVIATSGRAIEAAGDVDVLLLDKTGTITLGNRMATEFTPAPGITARPACRCGPTLLDGG